ncbi:protein tyrosine phosphatase [Neosynechococcus sphagnicola sy1]|uniref:Protein tyrosine phosphatase n=2 Tax=Neosynechococcus TaxID=1501143 RepID=A0A098TL34_9CYAN|nr:protein tyrosine phosphatase [Neosynechococcus sphagnicola sy1]
MNHLVQEAGLGEQIQCDSAGTSGYHVGSPPDRRMVATAQHRNLVIQGQARRFRPQDFEQFDLILAMDRDNYQNILALDPQGRYLERVRMLCDFCTHSPQQEVPDPYYGGPEGFNRVIDLLLDACTGLLQHLVHHRYVIKT